MRDHRKGDDGRRFRRRAGGDGFIGQKIHKRDDCQGAGVWRNQVPCVIAKGGAGNSRESGAANTQTDTAQSQVSEPTEEKEDDAESDDDAAQTTTDAQGADAASNDGADTDGGILVVYFSRTGEQYGVGVIDKGNTEIVADIIIEETGSAVAEITATALCILT